MVLPPLLAIASVFGDAELDALLAHAPPAVRAFVMRQVSCNHWAGEEPYDAERRREIARALHADRCDRIDADGARLRRRFAPDRNVLQLLTAATEAH